MFLSTVLLNSSSLSTNRKQTVCTTDRTPTALSIHKVEMKRLFLSFFFAPAFFFSLSSPPPCASCAPLCQCVAWAGRPVEGVRVEGGLSCAVSPLSEPAVQVLLWDTVVYNGASIDRHSKTAGFSTSAQISQKQ